ncbi:MAG: hypothetical protein WCR52_14440 [Bacteroidota bacterium]
MESNQQDPTPQGCFKIEELQTFQTFEGQILQDVYYYMWLNRQPEGEPSYRFIYYLELLFDSHESLLLTSGEDSDAIHVGHTEDLLGTAERLRELHGVITIQRVHAGNFPLWQPALVHPLEAIRLSKHESGLYLNDALLLDFGRQQVLVQLSARDGLELSVYEN